MFSSCPFDPFLLSPSCPSSALCAVLQASCRSAVQLKGCSVEKRDRVMAVGAVRARAELEGAGGRALKCSAGAGVHLGAEHLHFQKQW